MRIHEEIKKYVYQNIFKYIFLFIVVPICITVQSLLWIMFAEYVFSLTLSPQSYSMTMVLSMAILLLIAICVLQYINSKYKPEFMATLSNTIKRKLVDNLFLLDPEKLMYQNTSDVVIAYKAVNNAVDILTRISDTLISLISIIIFSTYLMVAIDWKLFVLAIGCIFIFMIMQMLIAPLQQKQTQIYREKSTSISFIDQIFKGFEVINCFSMRKVMTDKYFNISTNIYKAEKSFMNYSTLINAIQNSIVSIIGLGVVIYAGYLAGTDQISSTVVPISMFIITLFFSSFQQFMGNLQGIQSCKASLNQINGFFEVENTTNPPHTKDITQSISLKNISYAYDEKVILDTISLDLPPKGLVAVVGESGCGKSTLLKLLSGLYSPSSGEIFWDGSSIPKSELIENISLSMQESMLFSVTAAENIHYANCLETKEALHLKDMINNNLPNGEDTLIMENSKNLSGGQKQIIAIERSLHKQTPIYLFDEPTSAQDYSTQAACLEIIEHMSQNHLVVIVTHRLEMIERAHQIIVMDKGKIIETGTHEQLKYNKSKYFDLLRFELE